MKKILCAFLSVALVLCASAHAFSASDNTDEKVVKLYVCSTADISTEHTCKYSDSYFYSDNTVFDPNLALLSVEVCNAAVTTPESFLGEEVGKIPGDNNIRKTYKSLGFSNASYYNYNLPLSDNDDKIAFSFAIKKIRNPSGGYDTLLALVTRGGNYGAEWASNFHLLGDSDTPGTDEHYGFRVAAQKVYKTLNDYIKSNRSFIVGNVKLWIVGYSRGAAVANLLTHGINNRLYQTDDNITKLVTPENTFSYQFACPAGGRSVNVNSPLDSNIFVVNSPSDGVPMMAPAKWGFAAYGNIINLPDVMSDTAKEYFRNLLKGTKYENVVPCSPEATETVTMIVDFLSGSVTEQGYPAFQRIIMDALSSSFGNDEQTSPGSVIEDNDFLSSLSFLIKNRFDFDLEQAVNDAMYAHFYEHYIAMVHDMTLSDDDLPSDTDTDNHYLMGDANLSGSVTLEDVVEIQRYLAVYVDFSVLQTAVSDVNKDGDITLEDVVLIQKYIAHLISF